MSDFLFRGVLAKLDPDVFDLTQLEAERQARKLILIPSESTAPLAVREALASAFQNIYAEGYPDEESRWMTEEEILDYPARLAHYRRNGDPRYYKGVEYADAVEALARRRAAETFASNGYSADQIFVNVQALSGAPANNAVYQALLNLGDTVMGLNLLHGGHLSHARHGAALARCAVPGDTASRARIMKGAHIDALRYRQALDQRQELMREFQQVFRQVDVLVLPTVPVTAADLATLDENDPAPSRMTRFVGYHGLCAIAIPCGFSPEGLPVSVQLVAAPFREHLLLRLGAAFQRETIHHRARPVLDTGR